MSAATPSISGTQSAVVRGVGLIRSIDDLADTMVSQSNGNPVLVKDVATVTVGEQSRASASPASMTTTTSCRASC